MRISDIGHRIPRVEYRQCEAFVHSASGITWCQDWASQGVEARQLINQAKFYREHHGSQWIGPTSSSEPKQMKSFQTANWIWTSPLGLFSIFCIVHKRRKPEISMSGGIMHLNLKPRRAMHYPKFRFCPWGRKRSLRQFDARLRIPYSPLSRKRPCLQIS